MSGSTTWRRLGQYLGLIQADERQPLVPRGRSRYDRGALVSRGLDEDIDEMRARLDALERRLGS